MSSSQGRMKGTEVLQRQDLLEGGADQAALERLRRTVVVHHVAWILSFSGEEQAAEHGHLMSKKKGRDDDEPMNNQGSQFPQGGINKGLQFYFHS